MIRLGGDVAATQEVIVEETGAWEGEDVEVGEVVEGAGAHLAEGVAHGKGLEGGDAVGVAGGEGVEGGGIVEGDGGEVDRAADVAEDVETAAEFVEGVLDGAVLGEIVVDTEEVGGVEVVDIGDAGPLADVDGDVDIGLEGEGGGGAEEEGLVAETVGEGVEVGEAEGIGDGAAGGGTAAGGDGGVELAGYGEAVAGEEDGAGPDFGFDAEPGEFLIEAGADGIGQRGGPTAGGALTDEVFDFLQGGEGGGGRRRPFQAQQRCPKMCSRSTARAISETGFSRSPRIVSSTASVSSRRDQRASCKSAATVGQSMSRLIVVSFSAS